MNIYLTSYGIDTRHKEYMNSYDEIINLLKGKKVAIIPNARLKNQNRDSAKNINNELKINNINSTIVDLEFDSLKINEYNALYFSGGEPKYLMDTINRTNNFNIIKEFIDNGGLIIGQSAGAMVFNKEYIDTSNKKVTILNNGFDYGNKIIVPHYDHLPENINKMLPKNIFIIRDNDKLIKIQ